MPGPGKVVVVCGYAGTGNINTDPKFVNSGNYAGADGIWATADDGLQLSYGYSPAIDAGINNSGAGFSTTNDIINTSRPQIAGVDMDAYEAIYLVLMELPPSVPAVIKKKPGETSFALQPTLVNGSNACLEAKGIKHAGSLVVNVIDAAGRVLFVKSIGLAEGDNTITMDLSRLPAGMYYCCVSGGATGIQAVLPFERQ